MQHDGTRAPSHGNETAPFSEQYCLKACSNSSAVSGGGVSSGSLFLGLLRRRFCAESSPGVLRAMKLPPRCGSGQALRAPSRVEGARRAAKTPARARSARVSHGISLP